MTFPIPSELRNLIQFAGPGIRTHAASGQIADSEGDLALLWLWCHDFSDKRLRLAHKGKQRRAEGPHATRK